MICLILLAQGLSRPEEERLLAGVVVVVRPGADAARTDGRDEALDVLALYGRLERRDIGLDGSLPHILHRASAHPHLLRICLRRWAGRRKPWPHRTAGAGVPQTGRIKARKVASVATACPGVLRWPVGVDRLHLNAGDALVDVACVAAGLHVFAVVDDVHAAGDLTLHDFSDRAGQALVEGYALALTRGEQPVQVIRPRQVAGVRDEDSVDTAPHAFSFRSTSEATLLSGAPLQLPAG